MSKTGHFSRSKGRRGEQQLVLHLKTKGYNAERILNQAHTVGLPDVKAWKHLPDCYTFENKAYRDAFKTLYKFYYENRIEIENGVVGLALPDNQYAAISTDFEALLTTRDLVFNFPGPKDARLYKRVARLKEVKGSADFLVLKDNGKPRLFIKFY